MNATRSLFLAALLVGSIGCGRGERLGAIPVSCQAVQGDTAPRMFLEGGPSGADSLVSVRLCLTTGRRSLGSYHAAIEYDTSAAALVSTVAAPNGAQAVNANTAGVVQLAGASTSGFVDGALATLTLRARRPGEIGALRLTLAELTSTAGSDATTGVRVAGLPASDARLGVIGAIDLRRDSVAPAGAAAGRGTPPPPSHTSSKPPLRWIAPTPRIDSLVPASETTAGDAVVEVVIYGDGFTAKGNTVMFGPAEVGPLASDNGRVLRFTVPVSLPSRGEVPPMQLGAGEFPVRVRNANGVSNAKIFTRRG